MNFCPRRAEWDRELAERMARIRAVRFVPEVWAEAGIAAMKRAMAAQALIVPGSRSQSRGDPA